MCSDLPNYPLGKACHKNGNLSAIYGEDKVNLSGILCQISSADALELYRPTYTFIFKDMHFQTVDRNYSMKTSV